MKRSWACCEGSEMKTVLWMLGIGVGAYLFMMLMYSTSDTPRPVQSSNEVVAADVESDDAAEEAAVSEEGSPWRDFVENSDTGTGDVWPEGGLGWVEAGGHVGTTQRVCGPLMSVRETADGTFVNVGRDYPSADRFTFIFWDIYLQPIESDATICGRGDIYLYDGVTQMEMYSASALEIWQ